MPALRINHVSVAAIDLQESVEFYCAMFGLERLPTATFAFPTQWLRLGDLQLHVFERPTPAPAFHHIGLDVDDFEAIYERASELGILDKDAFFSEIYELPGGAVQMYLRDPAGNLIEVNWPDVSTLDRSIVGEIPQLANHVPQTETGLTSTLYTAPQPKG